LYKAIKKQLSDLLTAASEGDKQGIAADLLGAVGLVFFLSITRIIPEPVRYPVQVGGSLALLIPLGSYLLRVVRQHRNKWPFK
jgi:hypothetical protein